MIKWNEDTWYSRLGAIILYLGIVPALSFYVGTGYEATITPSPKAASQVTVSTAIQSVATKTNIVQKSPAPTPNSPIVRNPNNTAEVPSSQLADCQSGAPVIDLEENPSGASESATHVYDAYCNILVGATPTTFVALDYWYGKDSTGVWMLDTPLDELPLSAIFIQGADPATFTLIPDNVFRSALPNEQFSPDYTKDKTHVYYVGSIIQGADPVTFTIASSSVAYLDEYDAYDKYHKYKDGRVVK